MADWRTIAVPAWREGLQNRVPPGGSWDMVPEQYRPIIEEQAEGHGLPREAIANLIQTESAWNPYTRTGSATERGIGQFTPETARRLGIDPMNNEEAIQGAAEYLSTTGLNMDTAPAGYNWGPNRTILQGQRNVDWNALPEETRNYNWQLRQGVPADHPFVDPEPFQTGSMPGLRQQLDVTQPGWRADYENGTLGSLNPAPFGDADALMQTGETWAPRRGLTSWGQAGRNPTENFAPPYGGADFTPGRILNFGDDQEQGASSLGNIATGMPDQQRAPGPRTGLDFHPYDYIGPQNQNPGEARPFTGPSEDQRYTGAVDLRYADQLPFEDRWSGLNPSFEDRWSGDQSRPMQMLPRYLPMEQTPEVWPQMDRPIDDYQGLPTPFDMDFARRGGVDEFSAQRRDLPYNWSADQPPADLDEAYRPGTDQRTWGEREIGGIGGWLGREGNRIYDASADVAGQVVGGMGDLADWTRGLPPSLAWGGVRPGAGDFTGRFNAATPGWSTQDNTPQGGDDFIQDAIGGNFPFSRGLDIGTGGGHERFNLTAGGGFTPGRLGTEDPGNGQPWPGSSFDERFSSGGPLFDDRWSGMNPPTGGMRDFTDFRFGGQFPSTPQEGLDPWQRPPDTSMSDWRPSGDFPSFGFPRGGISDFRDFTPGGGFDDDFGSRFPTGDSSPTNTFDSRFPFQTDGPSSSVGGFTGLSRFNLPIVGGGSGMTDYTLGDGGGYNPGVNWQGPGGQGTIYDREAAITDGGFGYQSPTLTGGGGVVQNRFATQPGMYQSAYQGPAQLIQPTAGGSNASLAGLTIRTPSGRQDVPDTWHTVPATVSGGVYNSNGNIVGVSPTNNFNNFIPGVGAVGSFVPGFGPTGY